MNRSLLTAAAIFLSSSLLLASQAATPGTPSQSAKQPPAVAPIPSFQAYPTRPPADPAAIERGKTLFSVDCSSCHGSAAKGGEGGPNLVRSEIVLNDKHGELIATVVQNGRPERGMPKFDLTAPQISDIADFIHSFPVGGRANRGLLADSVVGNAKTGETFFNGAGKCSNCHSVTGDLAGIGSRLDPRNLQADFLTGGTWRGGRPANAPLPAVVPTVTVTLPNNEKVEGRLNNIDDFSVSLTDESGDFRTFSLGAAGTRVEIHNPVQVHMDMWKTLSDGEIHDLTAYLVALK